MPNAILKFNNTIVRDDNQFLSLTDMWKAARSPENKRPSDWLASAQAKELIEYIGDNLNAGISGIENTDKTRGLVVTRKGGTDAGTWAHWHVGLAYAKYLSPAFHVWCNEIVRAYMEGKSVAAPAANDVLHETLSHLAQGFVKISETLAVVADAQRQQASEIAALKAELIALHREHSEARDTAAIGESVAKVQINKPLCAAAKTKAKYLGGRKKEPCFNRKFHIEVRKACGGFVGPWARLPRNKLGQATEAVEEILKRVREDSKLADEHGLTSEQEPLFRGQPRAKVATN